MLDEYEEEKPSFDIAPDAVEQKIGTLAIVSAGALSGEQSDFDWLLFNIEQSATLPNDVTELWTGSYTPAKNDAFEQLCILRNSHGNLIGRVCTGTSIFDVGCASYDVVRIELEEPIRTSPL